MAVETPTEEFQIRTRFQSARMAALIGVGVAILAVAFFIGVQALINVNNNNLNKTKSFSRNLTCQVINADASASANFLITEVPHLTATQKLALKDKYQLTVTQNIEKNLGLTGNLIVNSDGSINCKAYIALGNATSAPVTTTTTK